MSKKITFPIAKCFLAFATGIFWRSLWQKGGSNGRNLPISHYGKMFFAFFCPINFSQSRKRPCWKPTRIHQWLHWESYISPDSNLGFYLDFYEKLKTNITKGYFFYTGRTLNGKKISICKWDFVFAIWNGFFCHLYTLQHCLSFFFDKKNPISDGKKNQICKNGYFLPFHVLP